MERDRWEGQNFQVKEVQRLEEEEEVAMAVTAGTVCSAVRRMNLHCLQYDT